MCIKITNRFRFVLKPSFTRRICASRMVPRYKLLSMRDHASSLPKSICTLHLIDLHDYSLRDRTIMIRLLSLFFLPVLLSGCAGLAVASFGTYEHKVDSFRLSKEQCQYEYYSGSKSYLKEDVIELWGEPDREGRDGSFEYITYFDGFTWAGMGAFIVVVPVPLAIFPSGRNEHTFYFEDNVSTHMVREYIGLKYGFGFACGSIECDFVMGKIEEEPPY